MKILESSINTPFHAPVPLLHEDRPLLPESDWAWSKPIFRRAAPGSLLDSEGN